MEIKQLKCFVVCAETGSFTKAAEILYLNQSNVSRIIKELVDNLNMDLFVRSSKGVFLTMDGENVYKKAKDILLRLKHLGISEKKEQYSSFTIAAVSSKYINDAYSVMCNQYEKHRIIMRLMSIGMGDVLRQLEAHVADVGFIYCSEYQKGKLQHVLDKRNLVFYPLYRVLPAIYMGKKNPFCNVKNLRMEQIHSCRYVKLDSEQIENYHELSQTIKRYKLETKMENALLVDSGFGLLSLLENSGVLYLGHIWVDNDMTSELVNPYDKTDCRKSLVLDSFDGEIHIGYVVRKNELISPYVNEFLDILKRSLSPVSMHDKHGIQCDFDRLSYKNAYDII